MRFKKRHAIASLLLSSMMITAACSGAPTNGIEPTFRTPTASPTIALDPTAPSAIEAKVIRSLTPQPTESALVQSAPEMTASATPSQVAPTSPKMAPEQVNLPSPLTTSTAQALESRFWLNTTPPHGVKWKTYSQHVEMNDGTSITYQLAYPSDWFVYTDSGLQIQSFPRFGVGDPIPAGYMDGNMKIDLGGFCVISTPGCKLVGEPITLAGLPASAQAFHSDQGPFREVRVKRRNLIFTIQAYPRFIPEKIAYYDQILGYMLSTLQFEP